MSSGGDTEEPTCRRASSQLADKSSIKALISWMGTTHDFRRPTAARHEVINHRTAQPVLNDHHRRNDAMINI